MKRKRKRKRIEETQPKPGRIPLGFLPVYVRETSKVFIGCHRTKQRYEIDICVYRRCPERSSCPQYLLGRNLKEELNIPMNPAVKRQRRKTEVSNQRQREIEKPQIRLRKRKRTRKRKAGFELNNIKDAKMKGRIKSDSNLC